MEITFPAEKYEIKKLFNPQSGTK